MNDGKEIIKISLKNFLCIIIMLLFFQLIFFIPSFINIVFEEAKQGTWMSSISHDISLFRRFGISIMPLVGIIACSVNYKRLQSLNQSLKLAIIRGVISLLCSYFALDILRNHVGDIAFEIESLIEWQGPFFTSILQFLYSLLEPLAILTYWACHLAYVISTVLFINMEEGRVK